MRKMNVIIMTLAGLLLMIASVLTAIEVMNVGIPSWKTNPTGFWESYEFLLIQIPVEFSLGAWMISGLFRKASWIAGTLAYFGFIFVTLYKVIIGAESCGCFGQVHVNPWITLLAIDMPFFVLLAIFRPKGVKLLPPPWPNVAHALVTAVPLLAVLALTSPLIVTFRPEFKKAIDKTEVSPEAKIKLLEHKHRQENDTWRKEVEKLKQQTVSQQLEIRELESKLEYARRHLKRSYDVNEIGILEAGVYNSKAMAPGAKFDAATQIMGGALWLAPTDQPDFFEISIGQGFSADPKVLLTLDLSERGKMILIPGDPNEASEPEVVNVSPIEQVETQNTQQTVETQQVEPDEPEAVQAENVWDWMEFVVEENVRRQLSEGMAVVLMYHHDCPTCAEVVPAYSDYYKEMAEQGNDAFKIAFLAVPPYAETGPVPADTTCIRGTLSDAHKWEIMSPYVVVLLDGELIRTWKQGTAPDADKILDEVFGL